jgi:hypothetical protein
MGRLQRERDLIKAKLAIRDCGVGENGIRVSRGFMRA